jgi:hypothetical protein
MPSRSPKRMAAALRPSSTSLTVTGTDRVIRDTTATSATWPMHGGCADLHCCVRGTANLGGIRRSLSGILMASSTSFLITCIPQDRVDCWPFRNVAPDRKRVVP